MIYFDNAATTFPKPRNVRKAVDEAMLYYGANPGRSGHTLAAKTSQQIYACRERAAMLFHCQPEQVVFTKNCTESINIAIKGLMRSGGHMIISDLEHNAVARVAEKLKQDGIIDYDIAQTFLEPARTVHSFERLIRPDTKLIACMQGSNVFGIRLPTEQIGAMAHSRGVYMLVDAAQTAGVLDINVERDPIDFLCAPGHKSLYGPAGTGLLIINTDVPLDTIIEGGTGSASLDLNMPDFLPDRLESGTVNTAGIIGLKAGFDFVLYRTPQRIYQHEMALAGEIYRRLSGIPGVKFYGPVPQLGRTLPVLSITIGNLDGMETADLLNQNGIAVRGGFHCAGLAHHKFGTDKIGTARISIGAFNTMEDVVALQTAVKKIAVQQGHGIRRLG